MLAPDHRVVQNFKCEKFIWDQTDYCSLGQKYPIDAKSLKIRQHLDLSLCEQSFSIKRPYVKWSQKGKLIFFKTRRKKCDFFPSNLNFTLKMCSSEIHHVDVAQKLRNLEGHS